MRRAGGICDSVTNTDALKIGFVKRKSRVTIEYCEWVVFTIHAFFSS